MIRIITVDDYDVLSRKAADELVELIKEKPDCVIGLTTGSSTEGMYRELVKDFNEGKISFKDATTINTDEYVGLEYDNDQSYHYFMKTKFYDLTDIDMKNAYIPEGNKDLDMACNEYNELLENKKIDLQILGIGPNGHIGFNEPGTSFDTNTHVTDLKDSTIQANARFFDNDLSKVPTKAITIGIRDIMNAKRVILLASGKGKAEAIRKAVEGDITEDLPASILQKHPDVTFILDNDAASLLK